MNELKQVNNPIIWADYPDPDVIRVNDTYYMASTTMHMFPGGAILRSFDLANWEMCSYLYDTLDSTQAQRLAEGNIYGKGMWAPCIRFHNNQFYVLFCAWDTKQTYLFTAHQAEGPWKKSIVEGFYHDASLLFEEDESIYLVYGNSNIFLIELKQDLSGPKENGLQRLLISDETNLRLGYEGTHFYKVDGIYYLFMIHWPHEAPSRRTQACFMSPSLTSEFVGGDVLCDDMGYHNAGVAQGGIVQAVDGQWYSMLFQDHGAVGRIPVLIPFYWKDSFPMFDVIPHTISVRSTKPEKDYSPLYQSDTFSSETLSMCWQWNHEPNLKNYSLSERPRYLRLRTSTVVKNLVSATNILTQRAFGPECEVSVTIDGSALAQGDFAGLCVLMSHYASINLYKNKAGWSIGVMKQGVYDNASSIQDIRKDDSQGQLICLKNIKYPKVKVGLYCDFRDNTDTVWFYFMNGDKRIKLGEPIKLHYLLDHFMGARVGLFMFSTKQAAGHADFKDFNYSVIV